MKESNYTSLEVSKAIASQVDVVSEGNPWYCGGHTYYHDDEEGKYEKCPETELLFTDDEYCESAGMTAEFPIYALTLLDCMRALYTLKNKKRWDDFTVEKWQHQLINAYQLDGMKMNGEHVSKFLLELFK
jgi:hypothetical protein